jgi:hypothetical protein
MNSNSTSLAVLYTPETHHASASVSQSRSDPQPRQRSSANIRPQIPPMASMLNAPSSVQASNVSTFTPSPTISSMPPPAPQSSFPIDPALVSDADLLLNLHSPFSSIPSPRTQSAYVPPATSQTTTSAHQQLSPGYPPTNTINGSIPSGTNSAVPFGDMMIESQDIDMSALGDEMVPWLEYLPHDMLGFFDSPGPGTGPGPNFENPGSGSNRTDQA